MKRMSRARRACAAAALALLSQFARLAPAQDVGRSREWTAPPRAASVKNPIPADDKSFATGKVIYARECSSCHGDMGKGNGPDAADLSRQPPDFAAPAVQRQTDGELFWKVTQGRKPMPRYARMLNDDERWHLVNYLRSLAPAKQPDKK